MANCPSCGDQLDAGKTFCGSCGVRATGGGGSPSQRRATPAKRGIVLALVMGLNAAGIGAFFAFSAASSDKEQGFFEDLFGFNAVTGKVTSTGAPLGKKKSWTPPVCQSGEHEGFHGVYLGVAEEDSPYIKIINDPDKGYLVKLHGCEPKCKTVTVSEKDCDKYDVAVERTNTNVNGIQALDGHLRLDCQLKKGKEKGKKKGKNKAVRLTSKIEFEGCY